MTYRETIRKDCGCWRETGLSQAGTLAMGWCEAHSVTLDLAAEPREPRPWLGEGWSVDVANAVVLPVPGAKP